LKIVDDLATVHHDQAISQTCRLVHGVGNHQGRQFVVGDHLLGQCNYQVRAFGIQGRGVLVQQKQFRTQPGGHKQGESLPLSSREASDSVLQPVFEPHV
jgi:hypothetical protein